MIVSRRRAQNSVSPSCFLKFPRPVGVAIVCAVIALGPERTIGAPAQQAPTAHISDSQSVQLAAPSITFEPNAGQDASFAPSSTAQYIGRGPGYIVRLEPNRAVVQFHRRDRVAARDPQFALDFATARSACALSSAASNDAACASDIPLAGVDALGGTNSYFPRSDPRSWKANLPTYARVNYREIFKGVDLGFYGKQNRLEYDFVLRPGADPKLIGFALAGAESVHLDGEGNLVATVDGEEFKLLKPVAYQTTANSARNAVAAEYRIDKASAAAARISFTLGDYNHSQTLVIDPVLAYGRYLPGASASEYSTSIDRIAADAQGNVYVAADLEGSGGAYNVLKFDPQGKLLFNVSLETTEASVTPSAIAVDGSGNIFVAGTAGVGLVTTANAFQPTTAAPQGTTVAFLTEIKADASAVLYSTYLGGVESVGVTGVGVDASGKAYVTGQSSGTDFPSTAGAYTAPPPNTYSAGFDFAAKFNTSSSGKASLVYSSQIYDPAVQSYEVGGQAAMAVDAAGEVYVATYSGSTFPVTAGSYAFPGREIGESGTYLIKWNAAGSNLAYTAFLGPGYPAAIAVDGSGEAYVTGTVSTADFPTTAGAYQTSYAGGYTAKLSADGGSLEYSTFLSGPSGFTGNGVIPSSIALTPGCSSACGVYIAGVTSTTDFPLINPIQQSLIGQNFPYNYAKVSGFLVALNAAGSAASFSTYLGALNSYSGSVAGLAIDASGDIYFAANIEGPDAPTTVPDVNAYGGYLAKISPASFAGLALVTPGAVSFPGSSTVGFKNTYFATLRNVGSKAINLVRPFTFSSAEFSETDQCGSTLAAGATCPMTIGFIPAQSGVRNATLTIQSDGVNSTTVVPLSGTGSDQPALAASSYVLNFANTLQGATAASQTITITNDGDYAQEVAPTMSAAPDYTMVNSCPAQLAAKATCQITVAFAPNQIGLLSEVLSIPEPGYYYYYNGNTEVTVPNGIYVSLLGTSLPSLSGSGSAAFSAYSLNFGIGIVGQSLPTQVVTVTNQGVAPLTISSVTAATASPGGANDFSAGVYGCPYSESCSLPIEIEPQGSASFGVSFSPSQAIAESGTVSFVSTGQAAPQVVYLSGRGVSTPPTLSINPSTLAFPPQPVGDPSAPQTFYLSNTGDGTITIDRALATGDFQIDAPASNCEAATLGAGTCFIEVIFAPTSVGARNGSLTLIDSLGNPQVFNLAGTGIAATGAITVSQASLTFPAQAQGTTSATLPLTIANPGNSPVTVNSITTTGDFSSESQYGGGVNNCAAALAPLATCTFDVTFTPTIASGNDTGTVSIHSTAGTQTVALNGPALAADTALEVTPAKIIFPTTQIGGTSTASNDYPIYLENEGNQYVTFTAMPTIAGVSPTPSGDFSVDTGTCYNYFPNQYNLNPDPFPPGYNCSLSVSFKPTLAAQETAILSLVDTAGTQSLPLYGTGSSSVPPVTVAPYTVTFPPETAGLGNPYDGPYQIIYFSNNGATSIKLTSIAVTSGSADFPFNSEDGAGCTSQSIAPGSSCDAVVYFSPSVPGYRTGLLTFVDSNGNKYYAGLAGYGTKAVKSATLSPQTLAFGPVPLGNSLVQQQSQTLYLTNTGSYVITVGTITSTNIGLAGQSTDFTAASYCSGVLLSPNEFCYMGIAFTPQSAGAKTGTLTVPITYPDKTTATLTAIASGVALANNDAAAILPQAASFPNLVVNVNPVANENDTYGLPIRSFTIANNGNGPMNLGTMTGTNLANSQGLGGDFVVSGGCYNGSVSPGQTCTIYITFLPLTAGVRTGSFSYPVTYGDGKKTTLTATFSGTGVAPTQQLLVDPLNSQFNVEVAGTLDTTNEITFTVSNVGTGLVKMTSATITPNFTITTDGCSGKAVGPVAANYAGAPSTCTIMVASTPLATTPPGFLRGTLTINNSAGAQQVALEGYVLATAQMLALSQATASFGSVQIGSASPSQVVYLVDRGPASNGTSLDRAQINSIALGGSNPGDFVETQNCGGTLGFTIVGRTVCEFTIAFAPGTGAAGTRSATITITPASEPPLVLQLVGQATQPASKSDASDVAPDKVPSSSASAASRVESSSKERR